MHDHFQRADELSRQVIGAAIEVHRTLGPGLLESVYEKCLLHELQLRRISCIKQQQVQIRYKSGGVRRDLAIRHSGRELPVDRIKGCAGNRTHPQGSSHQLFETVGHSAGTIDQFP
ncbi:MAG: GxxExxY protein [Planctomycetaceae bacterium]|nr:GxxExxY protein [Planctomycetaceae bacterium]